MSRDEAADSRWNRLYRVGGAAALITVAIFPIQIVVYIASSAGVVVAAEARAEPALGGAVGVGGYVFGRGSH